ncbi:MAG TPA: Ig-like domain-containing protein [Burkholderiaceae bacterium]|nr:Ig-like domain-containing protein [Burkholderiaceae bacterium]
MTFEHIQRVLGWLMACGLALAVAACGGGSGAGAGGAGDLVGAGPTAAQIIATASSPSLASDGSGSVTITAVVKDADNRTMANQPISFGTADAGAQLSIGGNATDDNGTASATLLITNKANRVIPVTVTSGTLSSSVAIDVVGTAITLSGPSSIVLGAPTSYTVTLRDSGGAAIGNAAVSASSVAGNAISPASITTDSAGQATLSLTGAQPGQDRLTVSALGASAVQELAVSGTQISFSSPVAGAEVDVGSSQVVQVTFVENGVAQVGVPVNFSATRGTLSSASATTNGSGVAEVTITSATAGISTISATVGSVVSGQRIEFVSRTPNKISLRASPPNVPVNLSSGGTSSSQLIAVVRDAADNPVKGKQVYFTTPTDPSNGRIEPGFAMTDSSGVASVAFFPGANSTGNNQIVARAYIPGTGLQADTTLTAMAQALFVRAGTGNEITKASATTNEMPWTARVTDASGSAVSGATVQASVVGVRFLKGSYTWLGNSWMRHGQTASDPPFACLSEDTNENGRVDIGEDLDGDGKLEPVGIPSVVVSNSKTDANGEAALAVRYEREYGGWVEVRLRVTITTIAGTEGVDERTFVLPVLSSDLTNQNAAPPGTPSPFGRLADCSLPG